MDEGKRKPKTEDRKDTVVDAMWTRKVNKE